MTLLTLILLLILVGLALHVIPMPAEIKSLIIKIATVIAVVLLLFWLLQMFGLTGYLDRKITP